MKRRHHQQAMELQDTLTNTWEGQVKKPIHALMDDLDRCVEDDDDHDHYRRVEDGPSAHDNGNHHPHRNDEEKDRSILFKDAHSDDGKHDLLDINNDWDDWCKITPHDAFGFAAHHVNKIGWFAFW